MIFILKDSSGSSQGSANIFLGQEGKDFEFSDLPAEVCISNIQIISVTKLKAPKSTQVPRTLK